MKKYKVTIELREKEHPYTGKYENVILTVEAEKNEDVPNLALKSISIPNDMIYFQMCWNEI